MKIDFKNGKHDWPNLATGSEAGLSVVRPLTEEERTKFSEATEALSLFRHSAWPFRVVEDNYLDIELYLNRLAEQFREGRQPMLADDFNIQMNRRIMNYLSSVGSFIAFTQKRQKRLFGRKSQESLGLSEAIEKAKSDSFDFHFVLQLRNYAAHFSLPLGGLYLSGKTAEDGQKLKIVEAIFRKADLLEYGEWDKSVLQILASMEDEIAVIPVISLALKELAALNRKASTPLLAVTVPHAEFILQLSREVVGGQAHIVRSVQTKSDYPRKWSFTMNPLFPERAQAILNMRSKDIAS